MNRLELSYINSIVSRYADDYRWERELGFDSWSCQNGVKPGVGPAEINTSYRVINC